jgi:hypothetical protein
LLFTGRKYALIELLWNTEILMGGFWLLLLKGFAVSAVGIMPYFGGGLTEKRWVFNRIEETVLPKVGIMTNREKWNFPILAQPIFSRERGCYFLEDICIWKICYSRVKYEQPLLYILPTPWR